ncbi:c-type cytochrome [Archangium lansingense]|uniref:C-type cytochrome n=1 Tax=Archangium lansingense TaxID=2995310 RepID=A0ABT4AB58_9BACT|nr:c-type cytochrome [Archangium lansinium]MCY1078915.1 c-type cytochrome [Archangium lansinium]
MACVLALLAMLAGGVLAIRAWTIQPRRDAELSGLRVRLERAVWLHEPTDHGDTATLPNLPGAPAPGQRRLAVELTVFNPRSVPRDFTPGELRLIEATGKEWRPSMGGTTAFTVRPSELLSVTLGFDVPPTSAVLSLEWTRGTERAALLSTRRPRSPDEGPPSWPRSVEELPPGNATAGSSLFHGRLACTTCHGNPAEPGGPHLGPALGNFSRVGATRVSGMSAAQYAYESLLNPGAFIAPVCTGQETCAQTSTMPLYGESLSLQEMADLVSYLVNLRTGE